MEHRGQTPCGEERVYLAYASTSLFSTEGSQGRNLEAGADAGAMEGCCSWLASHDLLRLLSYRTQDHQLRGSPTYNELGPPP